MDECQTAGSRVVGVSVCAVRFAMSSPACMGNTCAACDIFLLTECFQIAYLTLGFIYIQTTRFANHCHTGAIIAPVFESLKSLNQNGISTLGANVTYNSAHISNGLFVIFFS